MLGPTALGPRPLLALAAGALGCCRAESGAVAAGADGVVVS